MQSIANYQMEHPSTKAVFYEGTDTLREGYLLCYNQDDGTATAFNAGRAYKVEKPAAGNLQHFAGVVTEHYDSKVGPGWIRVYVPTLRGQKVNVWSEENCTLDVTPLSLIAGSYAAGGVQGPNIGRALQTVDRSSTNGIVQTLFTGPIVSQDSVFTASSRTTVQLPTKAIWDNFPLTEMRQNPFLGKLLETDFRHGEALPSVFADATYAAAALGKTVIEGIYPGLADVGELIFFTTEDNGAAEIQWPVPIDIAGGGKWAIEVRIKCVNITTEKGSWFVGLQTAQNLDGAMQADAGAAPVAVSYLGFNTDAAATTALDTLYLLTGQSQNTHAAGIKTLVANTYVTLGLYYNGTDIVQYIDGVVAGTNILGTGDMDQADFPLAAILVPGISVKGAHADDYLVTVDWIRAAQLAV